MIVKSIIIQILILDSFSLKDKRSVIKSMIEKSRRKFNISIAEVDDNDILNKATIGISFVSNDSKQLEKSMNQVIKFIELNYEIEIIQIEDYI